MGKTRHNATKGDTLTVEQENAIDLLILGKSDQEVADAIDRHRSTVLKWRLYDPHFQAELNARRQALFSSSADRLRALIPVALDVIEEELVNTPPGSGRAQIALALIKMLQIPVGAIGPTDPEAVVEQAARDRSSSPMIREWRAGPVGQQEVLRVWQEALEEVERRHQKEKADSRV